MARIKFEDGTVINFEGEPTPQDIDEAYSQVKETSLSKEPQPVQSLTINQNLPNQTIKSYTPSFGEKLFRGINKGLGFDEERKARDMNVVSLANDISKEQNIPFEQAIPYVDKNYDDIVAEKYGSYTPRKQVQEALGAFGKGAVTAGAITAPIPTAIGLGIYEGLNKLIPTEKIVRETFPNLPEEFKSVIDIADFFGKGKLAHETFKVSRVKLPPSLTKSLPEYVTKSPKQIMANATKEYRNVLKPTQGEVKNIEIRQGKDINDFYKLAAEEGLVIKQTSDKKLDTLEARSKLQPKIEKLHNELNTILAKDQIKKFNLLDIADKAKIELRKQIRNDTEYKDAARTIDEYIVDAGEARGKLLTASELNDFKQGMWSVSYDALKPNANKYARKIGHIAKEVIEKAYPDENIRKLNERSGKYSTLTTLLENAQGKVVQGGKLGKYVAQGLGAVTFGKIPYVGPILGAIVGGKVADYLRSPARITKAVSKKVKRIP